MTDGAQSVFVKREIDSFEVKIPLSGLGAGPLLSVRESGSVADATLTVLLLPIAAMLALGAEGAGRWSDVAYLAGAAALIMAGFTVFQLGFGFWISVGVLATAAVFVVALWVVVALWPRRREQALHIRCDLHTLSINEHAWPLLDVRRCFVTRGCFHVEARGEVHTWRNPGLGTDDGEVIVREVLRFTEHNRTRQEGGQVPVALSALRRRDHQ